MRLPSLAPLLIVLISSCGGDNSSSSSDPDSIAMLGDNPVCGDYQDRPWCDPTLSPDTRAELLVSALTLDEKVTLLQFAPESDPTAVSPVRTRSVDRLGLRSWQVQEGGGFGIPSRSALGASFNPAMAEQYGQIKGKIARSMGSDVSGGAMSGAMANVARTPLFGKIHFLYSEDPYLSGKLAVATVQGEQSQGILSNVRHLAAYNQEGLGLGNPRVALDMIIDERTLRELYLVPAEIAVKESEVASVWCGYPALNGEPSCENRSLLTDIVKQDWQFEGFRMSDAGASRNTSAALGAGLDFEWPRVAQGGNAYFPPNLSTAISTGQSSEFEVDMALSRILRAFFALGFFDRPAFEVVDDSELTDLVDEHYATARQVSEESIVLLSNKGILPLDSDTFSSIAIIGASADSYRAYRGEDSAPKAVSPREGLEKRLANSAVTIFYDEGSNSVSAANAAANADLAVVFVTDSLNGGAIDKPTLDLDSGMSSVTDQDAIIKAVAAANTNTIVVLLTGGPVLTPWRDEVAALLEAWFPGAAGGESISAVLFGDIDPSGRLPFTFPDTNEQLATWGDPEAYPGVANRVVFKEGLFVGYRHYDKQGLRPAFPFGHGLSYTDFAYSTLRLTAPQSENVVLAVSAEITNSGARKGIAVPQLYVGLPAPSTVLEQPVKQLRGFKKIPLTSGESRDIQFELDERALAYWNTERSEWTLAEGCYRLLLGSSANEIHSQLNIYYDAVKGFQPASANDDVAKDSLCEIQP
jgi:beta-glucosidase